MNLDIKLNRVFALLVFLVSLFIYCLTLEPTVSYWDCGEFISCIHKLQVSHQPGAPLFTMFYKIFTLFASSEYNIAIWSNSASAFCGAVTNMLIFLTITYMARKFIYNVNGNHIISKSQLIAIIGSGVIGALANGFSDTFWFSAVETEVYEMSSMFTALVFWLITVWEERIDKSKTSDKLIILIAYLMGLSIGVHLLNLLTIPAITLVFYFKKYRPSFWGIFKAILVSLILLCFVQYIVIQKSVAIAAWFDYLFVNSFGLPFLSGTVTFFAIVFLGTSLLIYYSHKKSKYILNIVGLCLLFIMLGYSSFTMIVLRSQANPPLNNSNPTNAYNLLRYLHRDQYGGSRPLLYGPYFDSNVTKVELNKSVIRKEGDKYVNAFDDLKPVYDRGTIFPRIYSTEDSHRQYYKNMLNIGNRESNFYDNVRFYFKYQLYFMYLRYFFWNFVGKQNDLQGYGDKLRGNFITGIKPIDSIIINGNADMPSVYKQNKGYNKMYALPLILGIIGLIGQYRSDKKNWIVIAVLFLMTGIILSLYLNHPPLRPRERDYFYVGSFTTFCIWIGLGCLTLYNFLSRKLSNKYNLLTALGTTLICLLIPAIMLNAEYDDHNRAGKYTARDIARNYLMSCEPNAILFTYGDNDTYPLWYCQEVENIRPDVRVVNLSLLGTDWYATQMKQKMNDSDPLPINIPDSKFQLGVREYIQFHDMNIDGYTDLSEIINFVTLDSDNVKLASGSGNKINFFPTKKFSVPVDKKIILQNFKLKKENTNKIVSELKWELPSDYMYKGDMLVLDIIANNKWRRPIYFAITVPKSKYLGLEKYFRNEGFAYQLMPIDATNNTNNLFEGYINTDILYDNMMHKFTWSDINGKIYVDSETLHMLQIAKREFFALAGELMKENKKEKLIAVLDKIQTKIPSINYSIDTYVYIDTQIAEMYYKTKEYDKADKIVDKTTNFINEMVSYYLTYPKDSLKPFEQEIVFGIDFLNFMKKYTEEYDRGHLQDKINKTIASLQNKLRSKN